MSYSKAFARNLRLRRLYRHQDDRLLIVPLDHSVADGPLAGGADVNSLVGQLATSRVDAVVLHRGRVHHVDPHWLVDTSLLVHLSASTSHAPDPDAKYLVSGVEDALRTGADAVSVHVNLGSVDERSQISDMAAVADACDQWNVPLLAMIYPRGPNVDDPRDPDLVAHATSLATDMGADIVKTVAPRSMRDLADIADSCPIPMVVAGGARSDDESEVLSYVDRTLRAGASGLAMGRNIFEATDPGLMASKAVEVVHPPMSMTSRFNADLVDRIA